MNSFEFQNWKNSNSNEMQDLTFSKPDDIFIFTRFTEYLPSHFEGKQVLFAENFNEAACYLHHIFLYDILYDSIHDIQYDFKAPFDERQQKSLMLLSYWYKSGKIAVSDNCEKELLEFCKSFNSEFNCNENTEYEIAIFKGIDELKEFLITNFSHHEDFDKKRLCNICSTDLYAGRLLREFLDVILN